MIIVASARRGAKCRNCGETRNVKEITIDQVTRYQTGLELCYVCRMELKFMLLQEVAPDDV